VYVNEFVNFDWLGSSVNYCVQGLRNFDLLINSEMHAPGMYFDVPPEQWVEVLLDLNREGLHEKQEIETWNLGTISAFQEVGAANELAYRLSFES
jgi:hypothetical protein